MSCGQRLRLNIQLPIGIYTILSPMFGGEAGLPTTWWNRADHLGGDHEGRNEEAVARGVAGN